MKCCFTFIVLTSLLLVNVLAGIVHVPQDQSSIQEGINAAINGDTVLVADSTYYENINFIGKAITVASYMILDGDTTHRDNTIINGSQPTNPDIGSVVSFVSGEDTNSVIYGFTITGGTGTSYNGDSKIGGGIHCGNSGARIMHNKIISNSITNNQVCNGGGIGYFPFHIVKYVIIEDNIITSNTLNSLVGSGGAGANGGGIFLTQGRIIRNRIFLNTCSGMTRGSGGGIMAHCDTTSGRTFVKIIGNIITNNSAISTNGVAIGGGINVQHSNVELDSNQISHNTVSGIEPYGGGIRILFSKEISIVQDNIISNNSCINGSGSVGGGLWIAATRGVTIQGNQFIENISDYGGGIQEQETVGSIISGNIFYGNTANSDGGGLFTIFSASTAIYNNLFANNVATLSGGGIYFWQNIHPQSINNTIVANAAGFSGSGILVNSDSVIVMNSILWGNSAPNGGQIYPGGGNTQVVYCDIQDGDWPGAGNINADPQFVTGDSLCHLSSTSPGINVGIDSMLMGGIMCYCPSNDYEGDERPYMGIQPDIGADETQVPPVVGIEPQPIAGIPGSYALFQNYPNPFNPRTVISWQLAVSSPVKLSVYDLLGKEVAVLVDEKQAAGFHQIEFDASRPAGMASGVYFYKLEAGNPSASSPKKSGQAGQDFVQIKKMLLIR